MPATPEPLSGLTLYTSFDAADEVLVLDVSDTTMASTGTDKRIQFATLLSLAGAVTGTISITASQVSDLGSWVGSTAITTLGTISTGTVPGGHVSGNIGGNAASITGSITASQVSDLGSWAGSTAITTLGTISTGTVPGANVSGNIAGNAASITGSITTSQVSNLGSWAGSSAITTVGAVTATSATIGTNYSIDSNGRPLTSGTTPGFAPGAGAGTSPSYIVTGNDVCGRISVTTGSAPSGSSAVGTITFAVARTAAPRAVLIFPQNYAAYGALAANKVYCNQSSLSTTQWVLTNDGSTALTATTNYIWGYLVLG